MILRSIAILVLASFASTAASAGMRPSFHLDYSVWKATHIVLATEGDVIDGRLKVIESWKGDLVPGAEVVLPDLTDFADVESRQVHRWSQLSQLPEPYVRVVTGQRMILFLVESESNEQSTPVTSEDYAWLPASRGGGFEISVAWIEKGEAYAFVQVINPGPAVLTRCRTALEIKAKVASFVAIETGLEEATIAQNPVLASQAVSAYEKEKQYYGVKESIEALANMGEIALPMLRALLKDSSLSDFDRDLIPAMVTAGGEDVAPELTALIEEEFEFWEVRGPELEKGWWNNAPDNDRGWSRKKYSRLLAALRALEPLHYEPCRHSVEKTHALWARIPALNDVGNEQMILTCERVLQGLADAPPPP